jgi:hypothetical protein
VTTYVAECTYGKLFSQVTSLNLEVVKALATGTSFTTLRFYIYLFIFFFPFFFFFCTRTMMNANSFGIYHTAKENKLFNLKVCSKSDKIVSSFVPCLLLMPG